MEILLTSFGLTHFRRKNREAGFKRMPPLTINEYSQRIMPEYAILLLSDRIILDKTTYNRIITGRESLYGSMALLLQMLYDDGFVRLEDFDQIIELNQSVLDNELQKDLNEIDAWIHALRESGEIWKRFARSIPPPHTFLENKEKSSEDLDGQTLALYEEGLKITASWFHEAQGHAIGSSIVDHALRSAETRGQPEARRILRDELSKYLSYVNCNLLLCDVFKAGLHDWCDFAPFYQKKVIESHNASVQGKEKMDNIKKLFEVSFPELTFWQPKNILRALKDKRIEDLRCLIAKAVNGEVDFDREFAYSVLLEVFKIERSIGNFRNIISYLTFPLGFIPAVGTPIQKIVEESIVLPTANRRRKEFNWFYLISDLANRAANDVDRSTKG